MTYESVDGRNYEAVEVQLEKRRTVRETCQNTRDVLCELIGQEQSILSFLRGRNEKSDPEAEPTCFVEDVNYSNVIAKRAMDMMVQIREILGAE